MYIHICVLDHAFAGLCIKRRGSMRVLKNVLAGLRAYAATSFCEHEGKQSIISAGICLWPSQAFAFTGITLTGIATCYRSVSNQNTSHC